MARGVMTVAETRAEAEAQIRAEAPEIRVLRSRRIDFGGLPPLHSGPLPKHWVVVVEHSDPKEEAKLPQQSDPEAECERNVRQMYLAMSIDPELLTASRIEEFACPACGEQIRFELPSLREAKNPEQRQCPSCHAPLRRYHGDLEWQEIERTRKPPPVCIFCGSSADSREHVVPGWIAKRLGIKTFLPPLGAFRRRGADLPQAISFASYRARVMCDYCNTKHFKHLEDEVIPLLERMARGNPVSLAASTRELLALWANKTAIAMVAANLRGVVPADHGRAVRFENRVAPNTWVGFTPWEGGPLISTTKTRPRRAGGSLGPAFYGALLTFGQLGFLVIGFLEPIAPKRLAGDGSSLLHFWPASAGILNWPPAQAAGPDDLERLLRFVPLTE